MTRLRHRASGFSIGGVLVALGVLAFFAFIVYVATLGSDGALGSSCGDHEDCHGGLVCAHVGDTYIDGIPYPDNKCAEPLPIGGSK